MKIKELVQNSSFDFNSHFRIYRYVPRYDSSEEGEVLLVYDSCEDKNIDPETLEQEITAINQAANGTFEIEFV